MLQEGVNPALIENGGKIAGFPVGPLEVLDATNLSLSLDIRRQWRKDLGDAYVPHPAESVLDLFVDKLGRPGRAGGKGFYEYPADGDKGLWPGLADHFPRAADQPEVEEVQRRLMHVQAIETVRCLEENVVTKPRDADIGSILGWGFPGWTGGVASYIDLYGADKLAEDCRRYAETLGERYAVPGSFTEIAKAAA